MRANRRITMRQKRHTPEEIVSKLRQVDVLVAQGTPVADAIRTSGSRRSVVIESWRRHDNTVRPHASLGYKPPAPEVFVPAFAAWPAPPSRPSAPATRPVAPRPALT